MPNLIGAAYHNTRNHIGTGIFTGPHQIAHRGLGYVPEDRAIFPGLTVRENLLLGRKSGKKSGRWSLEDMFALFPRLSERVDTPGGVLSGGEQQMLTICRTLMGDPDLILIDDVAHVRAFGVDQRRVRSDRDRFGNPRRVHSEIDRSELADEDLDVADRLRFEPAQRDRHFVTSRPQCRCPRKADRIV